MERLLSLSHGGGCGCKLAPDELRQVLTAVSPQTQAREETPVLRGLSGPDDGAVVRWDGREIVFTCDLFTPVADDPRAWGRIAAANALSDVYAMGGQPRFALNILAWPRDELGTGELDEVLAGGLDALAEAGALLVGGHSIDDAEPKYGLAVIGEVDAERMLRSDGGRDGDLLVLTKPLGVGVVITAAKHERAPATVVAAATKVMGMLNRRASEVAVARRLRAATDVTGFGLLGHAHELALASGTGVELWGSGLPRIAGVSDLLGEGLAPSGTMRNLAAAGEITDWGASDTVTRQLLCDPQSSGGLLLAVAADGVDALIAGLRDAGVMTAAIVGKLTGDRPGRVQIR